MKHYKHWVFAKLLPICLLLLTAFLVPLGYLNEQYIDIGLKGKEYLLLRNSPRVIFAGDSRAERQLIPATATRILGLKQGEIVNIAVSSGDPLMVEHLAEAYPEKFRQATVIISISAEQINDGARGRGHFATNMMARMNIFEQMATFLPDKFRTIKSYYSDLLGQATKKHPETACDFEATDGFCPIEQTPEPTIEQTVAEDAAPSPTAKKDQDGTKNHPWYVDYNSSGRKRAMVADSLGKIKDRVGRLIVFTGPFRPNYLRQIEGTVLYNCELDFEQQIEKICGELGIEYRNYLQVPGLRNEHFYNSAHLNVVGAERFTEYVIGDLFVGDAGKR